MAPAQTPGPCRRRVTSAQSMRGLVIAGMAAAERQACLSGFPDSLGYEAAAVKLAKLLALSERQPALQVQHHGVRFWLTTRMVLSAPTPAASPMNQLLLP